MISARRPAKNARGPFRIVAPARHALRTLRTLRTLLALPSLTWLIATACEGRGANVVGPNGSTTFARFVSIGTAISMGSQSAGVVYDAQVRAWPALLARQAGATFSVPQLRTPGCSPPFIAPLQFWRLLSGVDALLGDSSCAGEFAGIVPPTNNVALVGASAWAALNLTPKTVAATSSSFGAGDRSRYPLVLGTTQSQVTAMRVLRPSFVSVELGFSEVLGAALGGLLVPATSYGQSAPWTYVPPSVFAPVYSAIADSVKLTGAKAVLLGVPSVTMLVSLRTGNELWIERASLLGFGVAVAADCQGSANLIATAPLVPLLAARARAASTTQGLSCADVPGAADYVLTPSDVATLNQVVDQMNVQVKKLADANGWAFADVNAVLAQAIAERAPYSAAAQLGCVLPYGQYTSLDGVNLNSAGHQLLANTVAGAVNAKYGFAIPAVAVAVVPPSPLCP